MTKSKRRSYDPGVKRNAETERDILKKALAIFSSAPK